jgi:hypothetical protein
VTDDAIALEARLSVHLVADSLLGERGDRRQAERENKYSSARHGALLGQ